ncbi:hypothetical protein DI392_02345 [Vibrio albus]|uniref:Outer membrane protein beta-barrel domain-containing protein n=1 Tax=Vibrio albus TaxID=2200953 RepID=A0A2U3BEC9_9VIBR|nr:hypothetical protein [Vibrio albus]PWI35141.1 hypothetical protein DI392_02345 [Vibrio albus]
MKTVAKVVSTLGLLAISTGVFANNNEEVGTQDVYLLGELGSHELEDVSGNQFGVIFGARNVSANGYFYGGEVEASLYDNDISVSGTVDGLDVSGKIEETYGYGAYFIPVGIQFDASENSQVNIYAFAGYSAIRLEATATVESLRASANETIDGFKWGAAINADFSSWIVGLRYSKADLDYDSTEETIAVSFGHKIQL